MEGRAPSQQEESPAVGNLWALGDELVSPVFFKGIHAVSSLDVSLVSFLGQDYTFREKKKETSDPFLMSPVSDQAKTETASAWILLVSLPPALVLVKTFLAFGLKRNWSFFCGGSYPKLTTQFLPLAHIKYHNQRQVPSSVALLDTPAPGIFGSESHSDGDCNYLQ